MDSATPDATCVEQSNNARDLIQKSYLPDELILDILSYIPHGGRHSQSTLWAFCLVAKQWYDCGIKRLYEQPYLYGRNYDLFVKTICPSVNLHVKKSDLAGHVRILDLRKIVHQSSKSMTARLLGRTKTSLEAFVAPQASFAVNCLAALSKCQQLQTLDLSLISEAISIAELARALQRLPRLKVLYFPRSSNDSRNVSGSISWPPLEELHLSGPLDRAFIDHLAGDGPGQGSLPSTLTNLTIEHCTRLPLLSIQELLISAGPQLERLRVSNIPGLAQSNIDFLLKHCPKLKCLEISLDYITSRFVELERWHLSSHPLERLDLLRASDDQFMSTFEFEPRELLPEHLSEALDNEYFPNLRIIRVSKAAHWHTDKLDEVQELQEALEVNQLTSQGTESTSKRIGVWTIDD